MPDATPRHYRFEGYSLDTQTRELRDGAGAVVALTAKAFDTLCFLIENRQRVVGKEALFAAVWPGRVVEDNNLTQAIATVRRALGTDGAGIKPGQPDTFTPHSRHPRVTIGAP